MVTRICFAVVFGVITIRFLPTVVPSAMVCQVPSSDWVEIEKDLMR